MTTLLLSSRTTEDNQSLWRAAVGRGWTVERARGIRVPEISDEEIVIYVEALYAQAIAKQLKRSLSKLPEDWLARLPESLRLRRLEMMRLDQARAIQGPAFIKPPNDKSFEARVYISGAELPTDFADCMHVLVAEPVQWSIEIRCFCLDGRVRVCSPYLREGVLARSTDFQVSSEEVQAATATAESALAQMSASTPRAIVIDAGEIIGRGWAVVEANAAWGSGIYGCDPDRVLDVIRHATVQIAST